ncbi:hypothetical protein CFC21_097559 [Triticum aestivum]|uniref:DUF6598 domain-containing protein n=3 Tax=Triticum TaxID=4564 RepID=A0A9R1BMI1_TRITD|nr:uncharacterized protein LOC123152060 [Triticum aestivum]KAF7095377.1 hypothetical protein CFC21_097559 [Triticum aestivum]VAI74179.1 unnamed protein product [Triticum turgidum subsp. durum]
MAAEQQHSPALALPGGRYPDDLLSLELPSDPGPTPQRPHDTREEEEEEEGEPLDISIRDYLLGTSEPPVIRWEEFDIDDPEYTSEDDEHALATDDEETNCPGKNFPRKEARRVDAAWMEAYTKGNIEYQRMCNEILASGDENALLPACPLKVFPEASGLCIRRDHCHHREYKTHVTSSTKSTLGYRDPGKMIQIFGLKVTCSEPYPASVYGVVAIRDDLEPLRNPVFNRPCRDDALVIDQDSLALPLCSPCRGMYIWEKALLEVDLWEKCEGDGSSDKRLLLAYAEIEGQYDLDLMIDGQITGDRCSLVMDYLLLAGSVEVVIQVFAKVEHPHHLRFAAYIGGFAREIVLFDGEFSGDEKLLQHVVAVKAKGKLDVCLELEESLFWWTFEQRAVGAVRSPDDSVLKYGQFDVRVLFAPKDFTVVG